MAVSEGSVTKMDSVARLQFVKKLAATDKETRDKGFRLLIKWMQRRQDLPLKSFKKIWKGLFYCLWHADKPQVQFELAQSMAEIVHSLDQSLASKFFAVFLLTMRREWFGIDRLRIEKFYTLIRAFLAAILTLMSKKNWNKKLVTKYTGLLKNHSLLVQDKYAALGINLHFADIYIDEIMKVEELNKSDTIVLLLDPFFEVLAHSKEKGLLNRVRDEVFFKLVNLTQEALVSDNESGSEKHGMSQEMVQELQARFFTVASDPQTVGLNRKYLYAVHEKLRGLGRLMDEAPKASLLVEDVGEHLMVESKRSGEENVESEGNGVRDEVPAEEDSPEAVEDKKILKKKAKKNKGGAPHAASADFAAVPWPEASSAGDEKRDIFVGKEDGDLELVKESEGSAEVEVPVSSSKRARTKAAKKARIITSGAKEGIVETKENLEVATKDAEENSVGSAETAKDGGSVTKERGEETRTNLTAVFESVEVSPPGTRSRVKKKAERAILASVEKENAPGKRKELSEVAGSDLEVPRLKKRTRRVKFDLKANLEFAKGGPVPPPSLRTPPNAAPKGSALKPGVQPGPLNKWELKKSTNTLEKISSQPENQRKGRSKVKPRSFVVRL